MFYGTSRLMMDRFHAGASHRQNADGRPGIMEIVNRLQARRALLAKSDRQLADMGFSRELLNQGLQAWPWRIAPDHAIEWSGLASPAALATSRAAIATEQQPVANELPRAA